MIAKFLHLKMHSLLFVLDEPKEQNIKAYKKWITCCEKTRAQIASAPEESVDVLAKNVVIMRIENGTSLLGKLLRCAEQHNSSYKILYFESGPAWSSFSALKAEGADKSQGGYEC